MTTLIICKHLRNMLYRVNSEVENFFLLPVIVLENFIIFHVWLTIAKK